MMKGLSSELVAVLAVGAALIGITLAGQSGLHARMDRMEARLTARLDGVDTRLTEVETRLTEVETRLTEVETRLTGVETGLTEVETRLTSVETGLTGVETGLTEVETRLTSVETGLTEVETGLTEVEMRLTDRVDGSYDRLFGRIDDLGKRLASVEETVIRLDALDIGPRLRALETGQTSLREGVARIEGLVGGLLERLLREETPDG